MTYPDKWDNEETDKQDNAFESENEGIFLINMLIFNLFCCGGEKGREEKVMKGKKTEENCYKMPTTL